MRENDSGRPSCYLPEEGELHPLCIGRGFANCTHCRSWVDFDEDPDEDAVNLPLTKEESANETD